MKHPMVHTASGLGRGLAAVAVAAAAAAAVAVALRAVASAVAEAASAAAWRRLWQLRREPGGGCGGHGRGGHGFLGFRGGGGHFGGGGGDGGDCCGRWQAGNMRGAHRTPLHLCHMPNMICPATWLMRSSTSIPAIRGRSKTTRASSVLSSTPPPTRGPTSPTHSMAGGHSHLSRHQSPMQIVGFQSRRARGSRTEANRRWQHSGHRLAAHWSARSAPGGGAALGGTPAGGRCPAGSRRGDGR